EMAGRNGRRGGGANKPAGPLLGLRPDRLELVAVLDLVLGAAVGRAAAGGRLLAARADVVPLDHLVERRRLDAEELGGPLLDAAGRLERGLDPLTLVGRRHFLERDAVGRHHDMRELEAWRLADVLRDAVRGDHA